MDIKQMLQDVQGWVEGLPVWAYCASGVVLLVVIVLIVRKIVNREPKTKVEEEAAPASKPLLKPTPKQPIPPPKAAKPKPTPKLQAPKKRAKKKPKAQPKKKTLGGSKSK